MPFFRDSFFWGKTFVVLSQPPPFLLLFIYFLWTVVYCCESELCMLYHIEYCDVIQHTHVMVFC